MSEVLQRPALLTPKEVAERLKVCRAFVYRLIAEKKLRAVHMESAVRVDPKDLDEWIERQKQGA